MRPSPTDPQLSAPRSTDGAISEAEFCVSCGRAVGTPYCPSCGERRAAERRYSLAHFAHEAAEAFTNADATLLRTLRTLLRRPGELTAAYMRGQRVGYMRPLQLFLVLNVAYFLWATWIGSRVFDTPLWVHMNALAHKEMARSLVTQRLAARNTTLDQYRVAFDRVSTTQAKSLIILMVPAFAVFVGLVSLRRRRYAVQHLVFAIHAFSALFVALTAASVAFQIPIMTWARWRRSALPWQVMDEVVTTALAVIFGTYLALALRRAYGDGYVAAALKALLLFLSLGVVLYAYRFVLFFLTYWVT